MKTTDVKLDIVRIRGSLRPPRRARQRPPKVDPKIRRKDVVRAMKSTAAGRRLVKALTRAGYCLE